MRAPVEAALRLGVSVCILALVERIFQQLAVRPRERAVTLGQLEVLAHALFPPGWPPGARDALCAVDAASLAPGPDRPGERHALAGVLALLAGAACLCAAGAVALGAAPLSLLRDVVPLCVAVLVYDALLLSSLLPALLRPPPATAFQDVIASLEVALSGPRLRGALLRPGSPGAAPPRAPLEAAPPPRPQAAG